MKDFIKYPSIQQYRNIVKEVKYITGASQIPPTLTFTGTVKIHGTNAGICLDTATGDLWAQSRNNIITPEEDNAGFAKYVDNHYLQIKGLIKKYVDVYSLTEDSGIISLFGEWCGGNIQKGVGVSGLEKMFVLFGVQVGNDWYRVQDDISNKSINFFTINQFPTYKMSIDFTKPQESINGLTELTEQVEAECPVAKHFGVNGIGEGIVWSTEYEGSLLQFKVKGEKHSVTKVKKLVQVDTEKLNSINEFVEYAVTDNRLNQAVEQVFTSQGKEPCIREMGSIIKWMMQDINKEESDTLQTNNLTMKDINKLAIEKIRYWFIGYLDKALI